MADRSILYRIRAGLQGGKVAVASEVELLETYAGVVSGSSDVETGLQRIDGTGVGSQIRTFTGNFSAQTSNISEWFGNRQQTRLRCTSNAGINPVTFTLPGSTALTTAFDALQTAGLPEVLRFIIEYTGPSTTFLRVVPRTSPSPQIGGTTSAVVRTGTFAQFEIARLSGVIGSYVFQDQAAIGDTGGGTLDAIKLISPTTEVWDASTNGPLPAVASAVKGNAYKVVNAPTDGSGRFGEVMLNDDWIVVEADQLTSWSVTPLQWFVLPAHEVRRITALEQNFLTDVTVTTPVTDRNTVVRGADYADTAGELRLKIYTDESGYSAADLNTTGDIDAYTNTSDITGILAIRLDRTSTNLTTPLTDLYLYTENSDGTFVLLGNMARDFAFRGDFGGESDYTSINNVVYTTGQTIRIYIGESLDRYSAPNLDISYTNLDDDVQQRLSQAATGGVSDEHRLASLESKMDALYPLTPDVTDLTEFADIFAPAQTSQIVDVTPGYSLMADYRGDATRYEQSGVTYDATGTNVVRYSGLTSDLRRAFGFKVTAPSDKTLLSLVDGSTLIPYVDMTAGGNFRINNYQFATEPGTNIRDEIHFLTRTAGVEQLDPNEATVSTFTITPYPANSTGRSRTLQVDIEPYNPSGALYGNGHFANITLPAENTAQARTTIVEPVPIAFGNSIDVTLSYELRVSGDDLLIDFRMVSSASDQISAVRLTNVATLLTYTSASTTSRTDRWVSFSDAGGTYTFTGEAELLISFQPFFDGNTTSIVGVVRESTGTVVQLNDDRSLLPDVSIVEIPDDIDFRTFLADHYFRHSDLAALVTRTNTQWVYGLALLRDISEYRITGELDFDSIILIAPNDTRYRLTVDNLGVLKTEVVP